MEDCLFCRIAAGRIPSQGLYEDDRVKAFKDINPGAPVHFLVIPKEHIASVRDLAEHDADLLGHIFDVINTEAKKAKLVPGGYRVVVNYGPDAGQSVQHLHFHVLGGRTLSWPPG